MIEALFTFLISARIDAENGLFFVHFLCRDCDVSRISYICVTNSGIQFPRIGAEHRHVADMCQVLPSKKNNTTKQKREETSTIQNNVEERKKFVV